MIEIPLQAIPNQSLTIRLDNNFYQITLKEIEGLMAITIIRDGTPIVIGERIVPGYPIIPYRYLENGNFAFLTLDDEYPYYPQFGVTQQLVYASQSELETLRAT